MVVGSGHRCLNKNLWVEFAGLFITYNLLLPAGINWLTQLIVCKVYRVNNHLQTFEKNYYK